MKILIDTFIHQNLIHKNRKGGGKYDKTKSMSFNYNDKIYKIKVKIEYDDNDEYIESMYILHDNDEYERCMIILIYRTDENAIIQDFKSNSECIKSDIIENDVGIGTILMEFIIKLLTMSKDKLNIKNIILTDNSVIPCIKNKIYPNIIFSDLYTLINGYSWYAKFGFKIYNRDKTKLNNITKIFNNNKYIIDTTKYDSEIFKIIISDSLNNVNSVDKNYLKDNIESLNIILSKYNENTLLKDVLKEISNDDCNLFRILMDSIITKLGIESLSKQDYILRL